MRRWLAVLAAGITAVAATSAHALETKRGFIKSVYLSAPGNLAFRVTLDTPLASCAGDFVYVETSFGNYQAYVAGLLSAQAQRKSVVVVYAVQPSGYCSLLEYGYDQ